MYSLNEIDVVFVVFRIILLNIINCHPTFYIFVTPENLPTYD